MFRRISSYIKNHHFLLQHPHLKQPRLHLHPSGEFLSDCIRATGSYYELDLLVYCATNFDCSNYVDVGANIGNHVHFFSSLGSACTAFEPSAANFDLLKRNAAGASLHHCALADKSGNERFVTYQSSMGNSNLVSSFSGAIQPWGERPIVCDVDTYTLDSFGLQKVTLLKIDVEGAEMRVLSGAADTLARLKPTIWIELHRDESLKAGGFPYLRRDIIDFLSRLGYTKLRGSDSDTNFFFA